ncbi:major facilitator superfamily domain-containing protein [Trichoderma sp. SZMC 28014]
MSVKFAMESRQSEENIAWEEHPENPQNWARAKKTVNLGIVSLLAFITPLESSIIVPGVPLLQKDFRETNRLITSLVVSIFVLGFAFGPILLSPLSELYGRRLVLNVCNVATLAFSIASASAPNIASFVVFRFIAGSFGAGPMNIGGGSIADQVSFNRRGIVMSIFFTGIFLGPVLGPVTGGFVAHALGWRWVFWLMAIVKGVMTIVTFLFLSESHGPTIQLKRKRAGEICSTEMPTINARERRKLLRRSLIRPIRMLTQSPIVAGLSLYLALIYGYLYLLFTTFSTIFPQQYGFSTETLGLAFLGMGVGQLLALILISWLSDWLQERLTKRYGKAKPEYRLLPIVLGIPLLPVGLFVYGWTTEYKVHWMVPIVSSGFIGAGLIFTFLPTQIYMIDAFTAFAASALAATSIVRSIVGGILPMAGLPLYEKLGYGWGNSVLGFIAIVLSVAPLLFWRYGEALRKKYTVSFD